MNLQIPSSLLNEHEVIRATLKRAMREPGATGESARRVMQILDGHMMREEKFAFRPLSLLPALARGETPAALADALRLVEGLAKQIEQMRAEHRLISDALRRLAQDAQGEGKGDYVDLAQELLKHQHLEEEVIYPAALVVGELAKRIRPQPAAAEAA
jgi:iron-sulfur cluster repair protein YtfE (RIC family)